MATQELKERQRSDYLYFLDYRTRWSDNDQYTHINNSIYYHLFDSIINTYLIEKCGQDPARSELIGLVVSSHCEFFSPLSFPEVLELGLRVNKLGSSSAVYEVGIFKSGEEVPAAVGGYTHVFVQRNSRKSTQMLEGTKHCSEAPPINFVPIVSPVLQFKMSNDLQWLLLRKSNSFVVKRVREGPVFSKEPGNLRNLHSYKYSGLANSKVIDIADESGTIKIRTRKIKASPHAVASANATSSLRARSGSRRALGAAAAPAKRGYRPDLRTAALARVSALLAAQKEPKPAPAKKVRGKKAKTFLG